MPNLYKPNLLKHNNNSEINTPENFISIHYILFLQKMKPQIPQFIIATLIGLAFPWIAFAQSSSPNLRTVAEFTVFTQTGAVSNTGPSVITGDVGTNTGALSGFGAPATHIGDIEDSNSITAQASLDLRQAYDEGMLIPTTVIRVSPVLNGGEIFPPGVYYVASAGSTSGGANEVDGSIFLDAEGDVDAIFIFKFGGAFSTGANSTVNLINGASACNVFWLIEGAISMAANTDMKGTLISNNGAVSMASAGTLVGRLCSTTGALSVANSVLSVPSSTCEGSLLSISLLSFTGYCDNQNSILEWSTATETDNDYFTIERSQNGSEWSIVGKVDGAGNSSDKTSYSLTDMNENEATTYYRLKQTDFDGTYKYGNTIALNKCSDNRAEHFSIYPNPSTGKFRLSFNGNTSEIKSIDIFNSQGKNISSVTSFQPIFDLSGNVPGVYLIRIQHNSEIISLKVILN
jgi:hypothetical protein